MTSHLHVHRIKDRIHSISHRGLYATDLSGITHASLLGEHDRLSSQEGQFFGKCNHEFRIGRIFEPAKVTRHDVKERQVRR